MFTSLLIPLFVKKVIVPKRSYYIPKSIEVGKVRSLQGKDSNVPLFSCFLLDKSALQFVNIDSLNQFLEIPVELIGPIPGHVVPTRPLHSNPYQLDTRSI